VDTLAPFVAARRRRCIAQVEAHNSLNNHNRAWGPTEDLKGEVPSLRSVLTLSARPAFGGTS